MNLPVPSSRAVKVLVTLAVLVAVGVIAWLFFQVATLSIESKAAKEREEFAAVQRDQLADAVDQQGQAIAEANRRLQEAGKPQVSVPDRPSAVPEVPEEKIEQAVTQYLQANPPRDGRDAPTSAQIIRELTPRLQQAVAAYISANPPADGTDGAPGKDGQDGKDGAVGPAGPAGPSGTAATDEQVVAAVAAYCDAHDQCQGPPGPRGPQGEDGADSTVPGPKGEPGEPGPLCPDGWTKAEREVLTSNAGKVSETVLVCVRG